MSHRGLLAALRPGEARDEQNAMLLQEALPSLTSASKCMCQAFWARSVDCMHEDLYAHPIPNPPPPGGAPTRMPFLPWT